MTDATKKSVRRLTEVEKSCINQMLVDKKPHKEIAEKYNISVGTVSNMVKKLSGKKTKSTDHNDSKNVAALKESLTAIRNRKTLVEEMLTGSLKQELEQLTIAEENLEKTIDSIIQLEAFTKNR
jgi:transposase-like protein